MYLNQFPRSVMHMPKFIHYAAHAETLAQFFDGLDLHRATRVPAGSAMFIEFLKEQEEYYVRLYFKPSVTTEEHIRF